MKNEYRASFWGLKAAQAGLRFKDNPYVGPANRAAWNAGYTLGMNSREAPPASRNFPAA
jgi:hypothetical protein